MGGVVQKKAEQAMHGRAMLLDQGRGLGLSSPGSHVRESEDVRVMVVIQSLRKRASTQLVSHLTPRTRPEGGGSTYIQVLPSAHLSQTGDNLLERRGIVNELLVTIGVLGLGDGAQALVEEGQTLGPLVAEALLFLVALARRVVCLEDGALEALVGNVNRLGRLAFAANGPLGCLSSTLR